MIHPNSVVLGNNIQAYGCYSRLDGTLRGDFWNWRSLSPVHVSRVLHHAGGSAQGRHDPVRASAFVLRRPRPRHCGRRGAIRTPGQRRVEAGVPVRGQGLRHRGRRGRAGAPGAAQARDEPDVNGGHQPATSTASLRSRGTTRRTWRKRIHAKMTTIIMFEHLSKTAWKYKTFSLLIIGNLIVIAI